MAGMEGIEPPLTVLETAVIPFHHIPICWNLNSMQSILNLLLYVNGYMV